MFIASKTRFISGRGNLPFPNANLLIRTCVAIFVLGQMQKVLTAGSDTSNSSNANRGTPIISRLKSLAITESDGSAHPLEEGHWLFQWLDAVLAGGLTDFPIQLEEMPQSTRYNIAASQAPWGERKIGVIWLNIGMPPQGDGLSTREFVDYWYAVLFEIGNLMAADRFAGLWNQALLGRISEVDYAKKAVLIEMDSARIGCALSRGLILPLVGDKMPPGSTWKKWEDMLAHGNLDPNTLVRRFPGSFNLYREKYRQARGQRP